MKAAVAWCAMHRGPTAKRVLDSDVRPDGLRQALRGLYWFQVSVPPPVTKTFRRFIFFFLDSRFCPHRASYQKRAPWSVTELQTYHQDLSNARTAVLKASKTTWNPLNERTTKRTKGPLQPQMGGDNSKLNYRNVIIQLTTKTQV